MKHDEPLPYARCDVVDFMEADAEKRAVIGAEFEPTDGPECAAMHIIVPGEKERLLTRPKWPEK